MMGFLIGSLKKKEDGTMRLRSDDILLGYATRDLTKTMEQCDSRSRDKGIVVHNMDG